MKLYAALVRFFRLASQLYFADIHAAGQQRVPATGPVMLAANHPASILDAILLSIHVPRPIRYLARSGLFRWPVIATLFRQLGALPVYRRAESTDHATRNAEMFARVYELLEAGGCIGIFPEGHNSPQGRVGALRTGAARMALGVEARNGYRLGLRIVPVGITFESRELLMSAVLLRFGPPIRVADYAELHRHDPEAAVQELTAHLQTALRQQTVHLEDRQLGGVARDLATVLDPAPEADVEPPAPGEPGQPRGLKRWLWHATAWYRRTTPAARAALDRRVHNRQQVGTVLARAAREEPHAVAALRRQLERYRDHLGQARLRQALQEALEAPVRERLLRLRMTAYAVLVAPIAAFGLLHNAPPYLVTAWASRLFRDESVRAFAGFMLGAAAFTTTYALLAVWLWREGGLHPAWSLAYVAALPPTGLVALGFRRNVLRYRHRILVRTLLWNNEELAALLRHERAVILARFQALAERYGQRTSTAHAARSA
jgi:1-acyl-sn-glycerol-3-phosphate acyltransferase